MGTSAMPARNAQIGFALFWVYLLLYGGFVLINTFAPGMMEATPVAGVNLAVLLGFGLILTAFVLAIVYGIICGSSGDDEPRTRGHL